MNKLYPLKFTPVPKERIWGGDFLKKNVFPDTELEKPIGESLDLCGLEGDSSVISEGYLAGNTIDETIETYLGELTGDDKYMQYGNLLPIIVKRLDVKDFLSVQIHPDNIAAKERHECYGKNEVWYITETGPDATVYLGFSRDTTAAEVYERCKNGTITEIMNRIRPEKGDIFMIRSGCVHTCKDVRIIEVSQASDITYRLYDWDMERKASGKPYEPRETHLEMCIDLIDFNAYDIQANMLRTGKGTETKKEERPATADMEYFTIHYLPLKDKLHIYPEKFGSFITYTCCEGCAVIEYDSHTYEITEGETLLIPACLDDFFLYGKTADTSVLECHIPPIEEQDNYINPNASPVNENEKDDYDDPEEEEDADTDAKRDIMAMPPKGNNRHNPNLHN